MRLIVHATYGADIVRISKVNSTKTNFIIHCSILIYRMINQGGHVNTISKILFKTFARHCVTFSKFIATLFTTYTEFGEMEC